MYDIPGTGGGGRVVLYQDEPTTTRGSLVVLRIFGPEEHDTYYSNFLGDLEAIWANTPSVFNVYQTHAWLNSDFVQPAWLLPPH